MGNCIYCGLSAGLFSHAHKECEEKHNQGVSECGRLINEYFCGNGSMGNLMGKISLLKTQNFLSQEDLEGCCREGIKKFSNSLRLPIKAWYLQIIDAFINNIGVSRSALNKDGDLDTLAMHLYQGVYISFFTENEPISKVEKRTQIISRLLPISTSQKQLAGLTVLDKAADKFLNNNGLIQDSEQKKLDEFSSSLGLPLNNLPQQFLGSNIGRVQQSTILKQLQKGQMPRTCNVSVPIMFGAGEYPIWEYPNVTMYQEKIEKEWVGRNRGFSFRVMRGVYYRTGGMKGHPVEHSSMQKQGVGSLVLTNKNAIFYSTTKSSKIPYKKLIAVIPYSDGIELQKDGANAKREIYQGFDSWFMVNLLSFINV